MASRKKFPLAGAAGILRYAAEPAPFAPPAGMSAL